MKPTSIIFIVVSVVLIIAGFITMSFAQQAAEVEGIDLLPGAGIRNETVNGDIVKIEIDVKQADVEILGLEGSGAALTENEGAGLPTGSGEYARIELDGFVEGRYEYKYSNLTVSVKDNYDYTTASGLFSAVTNFKGFRNYLNYGEADEEGKTVRIYVKGDIRIECSVGEGNVLISGVRATEDCVVNIGKGDLTLKDCGVDEVYAQNSMGSFEASVKEGNVTVENGGFPRYSVNFGDVPENKSEGGKSADTDGGKQTSDGGNSVMTCTAVTDFGTLKFTESKAYSCAVTPHGENGGEGDTKVKQSGDGSVCDITDSGSAGISISLREYIPGAEKAPEASESGSEKGEM